MRSGNSSIKSGQQRAKRAADFQRRLNRLFSKADRRAASEIVKAATAERHRLGLEAGSDADAKARVDKKLRARLHRDLLRALPGYREFISLKKTHLRDDRKIFAGAGALADNAHVHWGDLVATDNLDADEFGPPFTAFDQHFSDEASLTSADQSFVAHDQGTMMNAFTFSHSYSPAIILEVFGLNRPVPASGFVSCGTYYTMPRAGRLRVGAVMQNFYSEVLYSLRDHWGFSYGILDVSVRLFIAFARGGTTTYQPSTILSVHRSSDGDDLSGSLSGFDTVTPYTVSAESDEPLQAGEVVQVLAGSEVSIASEVDDMTSHVNCVVRWQLKKLAISVI